MTALSLLRFRASLWNAILLVIHPGFIILSCCSSIQLLQVTQMRKWYLPLTVLGLGSLGVLFGTEKGREALSRAVDFFEDLPDNYSEWADAAEREIANIQSAVDQIAATLGTFQPAR